MKISYGIYQDLKGTPRAARPGHFVQCYALRYPRASLAVPGFEAHRRVLVLVFDVTDIVTLRRSSVREI